MRTRIVREQRKKDRLRWAHFRSKNLIQVGITCLHYRQLEKQEKTLLERRSGLGANLSGYWVDMWKQESGKTQPWGRKGHDLC